MVDAFRAWEHYFPTVEEQELGSNLKSLVATVIDEIRPDTNSLDPDDPLQGNGCQLELIGKCRASVGKHTGKLQTRDDALFVANMATTQTVAGLHEQLFDAEGTLQFTCMRLTNGRVLKYTKTKSRVCRAYS